jgi:hypothetical protein
MPKKSKNRSSKQAKQQRQDTARDRRRHGVPVGMKALQTIGSPYDHWAMLETFTQHWATDSIRMLCKDGEIRHLPVAQAQAHINAGLLTDGEPAADSTEVRDIVGEDILSGDMWLRPDGAWESSVDYFAEPGAEA